jgi:hypothetical protein
MSLNVLFQILWAFECFPAEVTLVWFQRDVDSNVRGDVVSLHSGSVASTPSTSQAKVVGGLSSNMDFAQVVVKRFSRIEFLSALLPLTVQRLSLCRRSSRSGWCLRCLRSRLSGDRRIWGSRRLNVGG